MIFFKWRVHVEHGPESSGGFSLLSPALVSPEEGTLAKDPAGCLWCSSQGGGWEQERVRV